MTSPLDRVIAHNCAKLGTAVGGHHRVLDHGFVRLVDLMGDDQRIVDAARVSYGEGTKTVRGNGGLIHYLMEHGHTSPFEMAGVTLHIKLPIFIARQWVRHRTASINEYSGRYSILDKEFYLPEPENMMRQSTTNRQGREEALDIEVASDMLHSVSTSSRVAGLVYDKLLADEWRIPGDAETRQGGLTRELARMVLPLSTYTQFYWKIDLHNLLHFLELRMDPHAQMEIRAYAEIIYERIVKPWVPLVAEAFEEHRLHALRLSRTEAQEVLRLARFGAGIARMLPRDVAELGLNERRTGRLIELLGVGDTKPNGHDALVPEPPPTAATDAGGEGVGIGDAGERVADGRVRDGGGPPGQGGS
jgi:thymidylate synthase (FAD)